MTPTPFPATCGAASPSCAWTIPTQAPAPCSMSSAPTVGRIPPRSASCRSTIVPATSPGAAQRNCPQYRTGTECEPLAKSSGKRGRSRFLQPQLPNSGLAKNHSDPFSPVAIDLTDGKRQDMTPRSREVRIPSTDSSKRVVRRHPAHRAAGIPRSIHPYLRRK